MVEADPQFVLRCGQCNKPFDKESTLKRHGYYCRSRRAGSTTRSRSCTSCARSKTRCDNKQPDCSRCLSKAIKCHYSANTPRRRRPRKQHSDDAPTQQRKAVPSSVADRISVDKSQEVGNHRDVSPDTAFDISNLDFADATGEYFDPDVDLGEFLNVETNDEGVQYPELESPSLAFGSIPSTGPTNRVQQAIFSPDVSIRATPSFNLRSFDQRPRLNTGAQRIANLILHTMKSYPLMMLRDNTLPPFIHPHLVSSDFKNNDMEPMANCMSLIHMLSSRINGSRKLFWKNVRMECERLYADHLQLNKWELLAAMQALSIYILIRLTEGETDHNNFDFLLVTVVIVMGTQFASIDTDITRNTQSALHKGSFRTNWKDWILVESARRLCLVYQVVNLLVYFEPAAMCDLPRTGLLLGPLPAERPLWEAGDELVWNAACKRERGRLQTAFGMGTNGDLLRLNDGRLTCGKVPVLQSKSFDERAPKRSTASWEEWCSGMDGLGGLVMLAASLVA